jgi:hypothetical protein
LKQTILLAAITLVHVCASAAENAPVQSKPLELLVQVLHGTPNGHPVTGEPVVVEIYRHGELVDTLQGQLGNDNKVLLENVPSGDHLTAVAYVMHEGMRFVGRPIALRPEDEPVTTIVQVFDVSHENSKLSAKTHHLIVERRGRSLDVTEFLQITNPSDLAITSNEKDGQGRAKVFKIPLPKGYRNFNSSSYLAPEALGFTEQGFYDTMATPPGDHEVVFSYTLDIKSDTMDVTKQISLPTANFVLFVQSLGQEVRGLGEADGHMVMGNGTSAEYYTLNDLPRGAKVAFTIVGLGTGSAGSASWMVLAVIFGAIIAVALFRLRSARTRVQNHAVSS